MKFKLKKPVIWRRIILMFAIASLLIGALLSAPLIRNEMEVREAELIRRVYAEGLIPCGPIDGIFAPADSELLAQFPVAPTLSITADPSFGDIESIHLVGHDLYYVRREHPVWRPQSQSVGSKIPKVVEKKRVRLSSPASSGLAELIEGDIVHAAAEWPLGLDGVIYYFDMPTGCAAAWSPGSHTRAGKIVDLFWDLVRRANNDDPSKDGTSDAALLKSIDNLRPN